MLNVCWVGQSEVHSGSLHIWFSYRNLKKLIKQRELLRTEAAFTDSGKLAVAVFFSIQNLFEMQALKNLQYAKPAVVTPPWAGAPADSRLSKKSSFST